MAKVKCTVLQATVDGKGPGETVTIDEKSAKYLESIRYVERVAATKKDEEDGDDKGGK